MIGRNLIPNIIRSWVASLAVLLAFAATPASAQVAAEFFNGAIAEYSASNANQNDNTRSFSSLGITKIVMSQTGGRWGGTQGNDLNVTLTIYFSDSTTTSFSGALNWQLNDGGNAIPIDYFGVTTTTDVSDTTDRYTRSSGTLKKTYILVLPSKLVSSNFATRLSTDNTDGSANLNEAAIFSALTTEFPPANVAPAFTSTNATDASSAASYAFTYNENRASGAVLGTVSASDGNGDTLTFAIAGGNTNNWFAVNPSTGAITLTAAGAASLANDFEQTPNEQILTVSVSDGTVTTTIEVKLSELNVAENANAPAFTGATATGSNNQPAYAFSYNENSATDAVVGTVAASDADGDTLTFAITGGNASNWFAINPSTGAITLTAAGAASLANDFEQTANEQILTVSVSDGTNTTTIEVKLSELDVDDALPLITGPSGGAGSAASTISVNEGQTGVTRLVSSRSVTWAITGGNEDGQFQIAADGTITFRAAPDFEGPTDADTNNTYILTVTATDSNGRTTTQTVTVTVLNIDDSAPVITGPGQAAGAAASTISINEGLTPVTSFRANETVTWAIDGGDDAGQFSIDPATGAIAFRTAPSFETPADRNGDNAYIVRIKATDSAGNVSYQTLTVRVLDVDEIGRKLGEIGGKLRTGLRGYATHGLSDMLSFNEALMRNSDDDACADPKKRKDLSGSVRATEAGGSVDLDYSRNLTGCGHRQKVLADVGLTSSRLAGNWNSRIFGALRFETKLDKDLTVGIAGLVSRANDTITGFDSSAISDTSLQVTLYSRYAITEGLRTGAFAGMGRTWFDFGLTEKDGFVLDGKMTGRRHVFGWMLSGDMNVGGMALTTDAVVSRAVEKLGSARLSASYLGESRQGIAFAVGTVDVTRISVPVNAPIALTGDQDGSGLNSRLVLSPGLLCEDNDIDSSALQCGYQIGAKFLATDAESRSRLYADYHWESVSGLRRSLVALGYALRFGKKDALELGFELNRGLTGFAGNDNRAMLSVRFAP